MCVCVFVFHGYLYVFVCVEGAYMCLGVFASLFSCRNLENNK